MKVMLFRVIRRDWHLLCNYMAFYRVMSQLAEPTYHTKLVWHQSALQLGDRIDR